MYGILTSASLGLLAFASGTASAENAPVQPDSAIVAAISDTDRPAADREEDARRKPAAVLALLGVEPGMRVIDVFSAGGWYTELLSRVVGPQGEVIAYNNPPYARYAEKAIAERYAAGRLRNVRQVTATLEDLELPPASLDAALFVMSYHDLYWRPSDGSWPPTDPAALLAKLHAALKPGAVVVVQDHVAATDGDTSKLVGELHRIHPSVVRRDFERAGFAFEAESDVLARKDDDHTKPVFDPAIRGKSDQFVYRFRRPGP